MNNDTKMSSTSGVEMQRYVIAAVLVLVALFSGYRFLQARTANAAPAAVKTLSGKPAAFASACNMGGTANGGANGSGGSGATAAGGCACCSGSGAATAGGVTGPATEGVATVEGDVQKISVDLSKGYYDPNTIVLKAGVPAEITFGQSSGCTAQVQSQDLGFSEDLTSGPKTVRLPALAKGEYAFSCGMQMVFGKVVVR